MCLVLELRTVPSNEHIEAETGAMLGDVTAASHVPCVAVLSMWDDLVCLDVVGTAGLATCCAAGLL